MKIFTKPTVRSGEAAIMERDLRKWFNAMIATRYYRNTILDDYSSTDKGKEMRHEQQHKHTEASK